MHLKSPISYTVVADMTMSGKNVKLTVTVVVKKSLSRVSDVQQCESKYSLSKQQIATHGMTNLTRKQHHELEFNIPISPN